MKSAAKRVLLEVAGWGLLLAGVAMMVLPGPGLLGIFAGLAILSQQYEWAERRVDPVKYRALKGAAESVENYKRIAFSVFGFSWLVAVGIVFLLEPAEPDWWPLPSRLWLPGGMWTGISIELSAAIVAALLVYSYRRFHNNPEAVAALDATIEHADEELHHH